VSGPSCRCFCAYGPYRKSGNTQVTALNDDLRRAKVQFDELQQIVKRHEATISSKQREISELETKRISTAKAQEASDQAKAELAVKMDALRQAITARDRERQQDISARQGFEKELDDLRKVMATKSSEDSKRQEADRSREAEMSRSREQVTGLQKALDEQREGAQQLANNLRVDLEGLRRSHTMAQRGLKVTQGALQDKEKALAQLQQEVNKAHDSKRQVAGELVAVREQLVKSENQLRSTVQARDVSDRREIVFIG